MNIRDEIDLVRRTRAAQMWRSATESHETSAAVREHTGMVAVILKRKGRVIAVYRYKTGEEMRHTA
jgi:hypothetical protein